MRDDSGHAFGCHQGEAEAGWCAVVEDIHGIAGEFESIGEGEDRLRETVECVLVVASCWNFCETKARQVGSNYVIAIGEAWDEFTVLERGSWKSVEQEYDRRTHGTGFAIEDTDSIGFNVMVGREWDVWNVRHGLLL